jgi:pimeloyl-ACP methyl ester carboxylesterase
MKKLFYTLIFLLISTSIFGQDITGDWNGILNVQGTQLKLVFHIQQTDSGYSATFDSPDQGAMNIPFAKATFTDSELKLQAPNIGAIYEGTIAADSISGIWSQAGQSFPLNLSKKAVEKKEFKRPQEPEKPYPYVAEEVAFKNEKDSLTLAGTLTLPEKSGSFPAVILISGSGPQNRDEEVFGHKPFLVLADHLTRHGIAVLRYDDRGTAKSTGNYADATIKDFAADALSAVNFLTTRPEIDPENIGLIGHSEGGAVAPMVANQSADVAFLVLLAGTGVAGKEISLMQAQTLRDVEVADAQAYEQFFEKAIAIAASPGDVSKLKEQLTQHYESARPTLKLMLPESADIDAFIRQQVDGSLRPWARFFYNYNPADELKKVSVPVLSLIGSNDVQVPAGMNQPPIRKALEEGGNTDFKIKVLPGLNHMFQESETGAIGEYAEIEQTFSPVALQEITEWIIEHVK